MLYLYYISPKNAYKIPSTPTSLFFVTFEYPESATASIMSSPITTLQQVMDPRSYPDGASSKLFNGVPRRETLQENSAQPGAVDDYQQARTKIIQDLVLNITRLAWQECSGFPSSQSRGALLGALDDLKLAVESPTDTVLRLVYQVKLYSIESLLFEIMCFMNANCSITAPSECSSAYSCRNGPFPSAFRSTTKPNQKFRSKRSPTCSRYWQ